MIAEHCGDEDGVVPQMESFEDDCPMADGPHSAAEDKIEDEEMEGNKQQEGAHQQASFVYALRDIILSW